MLYVDKNNNIRLARGDTAKFVVSTATATATLTTPATVMVSLLASACKEVQDV